MCPTITLIDGREGSNWNIVSETISKNAPLLLSKSAQKSQRYKAARIFSNTLKGMIVSFSIVMDDGI